MASLCGENCSRAFLCGNINVFVIAFRNIAKKRVRNYQNLIYFHIKKKIVRLGVGNDPVAAGLYYVIIFYVRILLNGRLIENRYG